MQNKCFPCTVILTDIDGLDRGTTEWLACQKSMQTCKLKFFIWKNVSFSTNIFAHTVKSRVLTRLRLEAHAGFVRLLMKGIFDPYIPYIL